MKWVWAYLAVINAVTLLAYADDKRRAVRKQWRIRERTLLLLAAAFAQRQQRDTPAQLFRYLTELARQVWRERCFEGGAAQRCARVLAAGYERLSQP